MCLRTRIVALVAIGVAAGFTGCAARSGPAGSDPDRVFVVSLQAEYHTQGDDKDDGNGISETFTYNTRVIAENRSHARAVTFRENSQHSGQLFVLTKENQFPLSEISAVTYRYIMDNDDGWDVLIRIKARDSNGNEHLVAEEKREIGDGHPRQGTIPLRGSL
jgi:hypothetical protein